jgi:pilus assembly protein Flp/PilA
MQNNLFFLKLYVEAMLNKLNSVKSQKGVTMIEYALIAALIAVVAIAGLTAISGNLEGIFTTISNSLTPAE